MKNQDNKGCGSCIDTEFLENCLRDNNLSKTAFCKKCKIDTKTFNKIISGQTNFRLVAIFRIARALDIDFRLLFKKWAWKIFTNLNFYCRIKPRAFLWGTNIISRLIFTTWKVGGRTAHHFSFWNNASNDRLHLRAGLRHYGVESSWNHSARRTWNGKTLQHAIFQAVWNAFDWPFGRAQKNCRAWNCFNIWFEKQKWRLFWKIWRF